MLQHLSSPPLPPYPGLFSPPQFFIFRSPLSPFIRHVSTLFSYLIITHSIFCPILFQHLPSPPLLLQLTGIHCGSSCASWMTEQSCMQACWRSSFTSVWSKNCLYLTSISRDASSSSTKSSSCRPGNTRAALSSIRNDFEQDCSLGNHLQIICKYNKYS